MRAILIVVLAALLSPMAVSAASTVVDVTPANIASQPVKIEVRHETYGKNVLFEVCVSAASADSLGPITARFAIWREDVVVREGRIPQASSRPDSMAWCQVEGQARGKARCYEAVVDRDLLRRATLTLLCWEPRGMPAFDGYEIMLGEFVRPVEGK